MTQIINNENILLIGSMMLIFSIFIGRAGYKFGIPSLLLFIAAGMFMGCDGLGIEFDNHSAAQFVGIMALSIILFTGGLDTKLSDIKPVAGVGVVLATFGVLLTAVFTGGFIYGIAMLLGFDFSLAESLLLASVMASTDSASVFALLRSKGLSLKEKLRPLLELESGSNDPMAFMLAMAVIAYMKTGSFSGGVIGSFFVQIIVGTCVGVGVGKLVVVLVNKLKLENQSIYSVFVVACVFFIYSFSDLFKGNGYLSVYLAGLTIGNSKIIFRRNITNFFEDFTWLWQIVMFVMLGLIVKPSDLLNVALFGAAIGVFMILFGRPLSVVACMLPFRKFSASAIKYVSWVGLRGAVPIIFATYLFTSGIDKAQTMFNVVFFITILSLVVQGMSVGIMAKFFGVADENAETETSFGVELPDEIKSAMVEISVDDNLLAGGDTLSKFPMPANTLVMMVRRGNSFFIPRGDTKIQSGDKLLVISDNAATVSASLEKLGIKHYKMDRS